MNRQRSKRGFTMAEMLIVVAIIGALAAVAFVAVAQHQRSLERLERDSIAREIFMAAQNHLTMAESQGYLGLGLEGEDILGSAEDATKGIYYFAVFQGDKFSKSPTGAPQSLLDLMLPFGSVEEMERTGGSYIIRYHKDTATIMDVFYCSTDERYGYNLSGEKPADLMEYSGDNNASKRRNFKGKILGWYGGADAESLTLGAKLEEPVLVVENAERLRVLLNDPNTGDHILQIIVTGETSHVQKVFTLVSTATGFILDDQDYSDRVKHDVTVNGVGYDFALTLDSITEANQHFADLKGVKPDSSAEVPFIPGEDITVQAFAFSNKELTNIAYSEENTVNSLFEKIDMDDAELSMKASINNLRHLENLDESISHVTTTRELGTDTDKKEYKLESAAQTTDMSWNAFKTAIGGDSPSVYLYGEDAGQTAEGCYLPVSPAYLLSYDGQGHSVADIMVNYGGDAGLFSKLEGTEEKHIALSNLALIDFNIVESSESGSANAGALAGSLAYVDVNNVIAYDRNPVYRISSTTGNAGGLIGNADNCSISKSAASVYVSSTAASHNAGGLIGAANNSTVSACYSAAHTHDATYYKAADTPDYNVTASSGTAGGLIGYASQTPIKYSYSTCSATGETAGGLVGVAANGSIDYCYATGLISGTGTDPVTLPGATTSVSVSKDGAFAYSLTSTDISNCYYYEIINERDDDSLGLDYLTALGKKDTHSNITAIDATVESYNTFVGKSDVWKLANAYDDALVQYYRTYSEDTEAYIGRYNLKTVEQLMKLEDADATLKTDTDDTTTYFVATHYGDWPAPEIFVTNTAAS